MSAHLCCRMHISCHRQEGVGSILSIFFLVLWRCGATGWRPRPKDVVFFRIFFFAAHTMQKIDFIVIASRRPFFWWQPMVPKTFYLLNWIFALITGTKNSADGRLLWRA